MKVRTNLFRRLDYQKSIQSPGGPYIYGMHNFFVLGGCLLALSIYTIILSKLANCRSQFLLDRLGRCLKLFVLSESTPCRKFASQFGLAIFFTRKTHTTSGNRIALACVYLSETATPMHICRQRNGPSRLCATNPSHSANLKCSAVCVCARACVCTCVRACVREVFSIYDNNI